MCLNFCSLAGGSDLEGCAISGMGYSLPPAGGNGSLKVNPEGSCLALCFLVVPLSTKTGPLLPLCLPSHDRLKFLEAMTKNFLLKLLG